MLLLSIVSLKTEGAIWTLHGCKDNYLQVRWIADQNPPFYWGGTMDFDWTWDQLYPDQSDSGIQTWDLSGSTSWTGYSDALSLDVPDLARCWNAYQSGSGPNYDGWNDWSLYWETMVAGEYWIDFAPDGAVRISTTSPSDFGKWAWDGSVNPSWVEPPLAPAQQGKRLAKGHNK